jgi:hypothetical protein
MPARDRRRLKSAAARARAGSKSKRRNVNFQNEPWYAEAARKLSAAKKPAELHR